MGSENSSKGDLNNILKDLMNGILEEEASSYNLKLLVEAVDTGIFVSPGATMELIKSPVTKDDVRENIGMLIEMKVREVMGGLLNRVLIRLHINARREVEIRNRGVHEAEILEGDVEDNRLREDRVQILEEKSTVMSRTVKLALERIMSTS